MINKIVDRMIKQMDFSWLYNKKPKKESLLKDLFNDPDTFEFNGYVENGEIKISIRKRIHEDEA